MHEHFQQGLLSRRRTIYFVLMIVCAVLSLRPIPVVGGVIELLFVPTRVVAELVSPLNWLRSSEVRAAEERIDAEAQVVRGAAAQLLRIEQESALPTRPELLEGRRMIHGEVLRRRRSELDRLIVRVASTEGIVPGLPVVTGDHYVGRVVRLGEEENMIIVDLVTKQGFFVGASIAQEDWRGEPTGERVEFVVGGLAKQSEEEKRRNSQQLHLSLHNPSMRGIRSGEVLVSEPDDMDPEIARLSRGFSLGQLFTVRSTRGTLLRRIQSPLDLKSGLFQLIVLAPPTDSREPDLIELDTFVVDNWLASQTLTRGDVTPTREGRRLSRGVLGGLKRGQAVALGAHLVGRVGETELFTADLVGLGDPGVRLAVLAEIEGESAPRPLGELISLGRQRSDGSLSFLWVCRIDLGRGVEGERLRADLYTGSGESGVPRGLFIGETVLPTTRETHRLTVWQDPAVRDLGQVFVWRGPKVRKRASLAGAGGSKP